MSRSITLLVNYYRGYNVLQRNEVLTKKAHALGRTGITLPWGEAFMKVISIGKMLIVMVS